MKVPILPSFLPKSISTVLFSYHCHELYSIRIECPPDVASQTSRIEPYFPHRTLLGVDRVAGQAYGV